MFSAIPEPLANPVGGVAITHLTTQGSSRSVGPEAPGLKLREWKRVANRTNRGSNCFELMHVSACEENLLGS